MLYHPSDMDMILQCRAGAPFECTMAVPADYADSTGLASTYL
jgi:hypothetical protein